MQAQLKPEKKEFYKCNLYYLRKFFGIKELVMMFFLLLAGLVLYFLYESKLILILFGVFLAVGAVAFAFYFYTVYKGWQLEYANLGVAEVVFAFDEVATTYTVSLNNAEGKAVSIDQFDLKNADKVAFLKGKVYLYQGAATMYYLYPSSFAEGEYEKFREKLALNLDIEKFKMKTKRKVFPKPLIK